MTTIHLIIGTVLFTLAFCTVAPAGPELPGKAPGRAKAEVQGDRLVLENDLLAIEWDLSAGLHLVQATDKQSGDAWLTGVSECLQLLIIEAPDPKPIHLRGSDMEFIAPPVVCDAPVNPSTGRKADGFPGKEIVLQLAARDRSIKVEWRATLRDESNYVRQTVELIAGDDWVETSEVTLLDVTAQEAEVRGSVDGSPATAGRWFLGFEHPIARSEVLADTRDPSLKRVRGYYPFAPPLSPGAKRTYSSVIGLTPENQLRRGFLYYLERERAQPYKPFLHNDPSEDSANIYSKLAGKPEELKQFQLRQNQWWQGVIDAFGRELVTKRNVQMDCFAHDFLWDRVESIWLFDGEIYPNGFAEARAVANKYGASLGVWYSPDAVTGSRGRVVAGIEQKFEGYLVGDTYDAYTLGLSLSGPRYFARFRSSVINMLKNQGVGYFKFDGIADGYKYDAKPFGPGPFPSDVEALLEVYSEMRKLNPSVFINSSTGAWPSPFFLRWADSIWHQGSDVGDYGPDFKGWSKGPPRQRWITYRDSATYYNGLVRGPLYPLNSYMVHGIEYNTCSTGDGRLRVRGLETKDLVDEIRSYFASGTNLQELMLTPELMTPETWDVLAEAARWSRANMNVLVDVHWIGGDPAKQSVYGWAAWAPQKGILSLRNPEDVPQSITIDLAEAFELPDGAPRTYRLNSPWNEHADRAAIELSAGMAHEFQLQPFEVMVFDAIPLE
jgi:hypothetical protein